MNSIKTHAAAGIRHGRVGGRRSSAGSHDPLTRRSEVFAAVTGLSSISSSRRCREPAFPWIVLWLVVAATIFTIYFGFVQFRFFGHASVW